MRRVFAALAVVLALIGIANIVTFVAFTLYLGGSPLSGYARDGHYYVTDHGHVREVTAAQWRWSRRQMRSLIVTVPLTMVCLAFLTLRFVYPRLMFRAGGAALAATARAVQGSGPPLASVRCGGRVGGLRYNGPLLRATVFPGGVVIEPLFQAAFAVPVAAISAVAFTRVGLGVPVVELVHTSTEVASPLLLQVTETQPFAAALRDLVAVRGDGGAVVAPAG